MTEEQVKDWLYRLRSEIDFMSVNPEHRENFKMAIDEGIKAFDTVKEFEKAQIITGGRLNGRTHAYKCGLEDGERKALEKQSDDCVSRQAVIDTVDNTIAKYIPIFIGPYEKIPLELARAIKDVSPVTPAQRWIPVSERLPKPNTAVLTYISTGPSETFCLAYWNDIQNYWEDWIGYKSIEKERGYKVLAWQPLPEPYGERE